MKDAGTGASRRILVISFSQSGQLHQIVDSLLAPLRERTSVDVINEELAPVPAFPFPWSAYQFLEVFPESYREIACPLKALKAEPGENFDLVILAYQVWYLSPSIPVSSFLQSDEAKALLNNKPVLTIVGCRNTWFRAHESVKKHLRATNARLIGHIALTDRVLNLVSVVTFLRWMLTGNKDRLFGLLPKPGVSDQDIRRCGEFGTIIAKALTEPVIPNIQGRLNQANACHVVPHMMALENVGSRAFRVWSALIIRSGERERLLHRCLVTMFGIYVACGLALFSPLSYLTFYITLVFRRSTVKRQIQSLYQYDVYPQGSVER